MKLNGINYRIVVGRIAYVMGYPVRHGINTIFQSKIAGNIGTGMGLAVVAILIATFVIGQQVTTSSILRKTMAAVYLYRFVTVFCVVLNLIEVGNIHFNTSGLRIADIRPVLPVWHRLVMF